MDLSAIASLPEVKSAVVCDRAGVLVQAEREPDGEAVAAVAGFLTVTLAEMGDELGLGPLHRLAVAGPSRASLVVVMADEVLSAVIEPSSAFPAVEHAVDALLQG